MPRDLTAADRLTSDERQLVEALTRRAMPELIEELLRRRPLPCQAYVARAYARAAVNAASAPERSRFLDQALSGYRSVLGVKAHREWFQTEIQRLEFAGWCVELGDLLLRQAAAPEMDRFEASSGLDCDRPRLTTLIGESRDAYNLARPILEDLAIGLRTEEERYLLLGIADQIGKLSDQRLLNASWAALYLAMVDTVRVAQRASLLAEALAGFDAVARSARDPARKYNALIGAGIALRESRRFQEAVAAFDRVVASTAPRSILARAMYEKARSLLASREFGRAASQIDALEAFRANASEADAVFYVRMAPILRAWSFVLESQITADQIEQKQLTSRALAAFDEAARKSEALARLAETYRTAILGKTRSLDELPSTDLRKLAARRMAEGDHAGAADCFRRIMEKTKDTQQPAEDRLNYGVCLFQLERLQDAAAQFNAAVEAAGVDPAIAERLAEYSYRCTEQLARATRTSDNYQALAQSAQRLASRFPRNAFSESARWMAACALQEAGDLAAAESACGKIPASSPWYWPARRKQVICAERAFELSAAAIPPQRRAELARQVVAAWLTLADDLGRRVADSARHGRPAPASAPADARFDAVEWAREARLAAAALMVGQDLRAFREAEQLLAKMPESAAVLRLRIACHQGLGDLDAAKQVLQAYLEKAPAEERGAVLGALISDLERQATELRRGKHIPEADKMDRELVPLLQDLLQWASGQPDYAQHAGAVRSSLVQVLHRLGKRDEALAEADALLRAEPENGDYLLLAARLCEESHKAAPQASPASSRTRCVELWEMLLSDASLREESPDAYWEARFRWLSHQLESGHAADVLRAIDSERAWYPELGGPGWQARFSELADRARAAVPQGSP